MASASSAAPSLSAVGPIQFNTDTVRAAERVSFWKEAICSSFVRLEFDCDQRKPFSASLAARSMGRFDCIAVGGSAQRVSRSERLIADDPR